MYVVVEHMITNPDAFFALAGKVGEAPSGLNTIHFSRVQAKIGQCVYGKPIQ